MNNPKFNLLITLGVLSLIIIGIAFFGIQPLWTRLTTQRAEQKETEEEYKKLEERINTLAKLAQEKDEIEELGQKAMTYLPTSVSASPFVMDVAAIGGLSGTSVPTLTFQEPDVKKGGSGATEYPITMTVEGNFDQIHRFLELLEENLRFNMYSSVVFSSLEGRQGLQLSGAIFSKPTDKNDDASLTIEKTAQTLLESRQSFGAPVPGSSGKNNPFDGF